MYRFLVLKIGDNMKVFQGGKHRDTSRVVGGYSMYNMVLRYSHTMIQQKNHRGEIE